MQHGGDVDNCPNVFADYPKVCVRDVQRRYLMIVATQRHKSVDYAAAIPR